MNILFMCRLYWPHVGGVEKHVEKISEILKKKHEITIVCEKHDPKLPDYEMSRGVAIYRIRGADKWTTWKWWFSHLNLINNADIVHIHDVFFWFLPFRLPYWSKKVFVTFHGWEGVYPILWKNIVIRKVSEWMAKGNICVGEFIKKYYGTKPDYVIYGAAEKSKYPKVKRQGAIFVGRLDADQGLDYYKSLARKMKVKLDIFTSDPNAGKYFYKYKYAFVSGYLTILEAMAQNTPVFTYCNNPLKYDYLNMTPFKDQGFRIPTWSDVADIYEKLWQK